MYATASQMDVAKFADKVISHNPPLPVYRFTLCLSGTTIKPITA